VVLSEDLAKYDAQFEGATIKIVDVLRTGYKGDEAQVDNACRIADRKLLDMADTRNTRVVFNELSMCVFFFDLF
jgi:hypothetical protein